MPHYTWFVPEAYQIVGRPLPAIVGRGNIGLVGASSVLLHFSEPDGVRPSDSAGNLDDLAPTVGLTAPAVVDAWSGRGRAFTATTGLIAADLAGRDTHAFRDVSLQVIAAVTRDSLPGGGGTIYVRGTGDGGAEAHSFGVDLAPAGVGGVNVRAFWHDAAGVLRAQTAAAYAHPGDAEFVLLTVTRRWESTTRVIVRYYFGDQLVAEVVSADGSIGGSTVGTTAIGARIVSGAWSAHFVGTLDELRLVPYEMSAEEIRATYQRIAVWQPAGVDMITGLLPPGVSWGRDPSSRIGRLVRIAGQAFGYAMARAEEFRASWFPDSGYLDTVAQWEAIYRVAPRPRDSLDSRRARIAALSRRVGGYSVPALQAALAPLFDLEPEDVQIIEFENEIRDDFTTLSADRWELDPSSAWTLDTNALRLQLASGASVSGVGGASALASLSSGEGALVIACKLSPASWPVGVTCGLMLYRGDDRAWFGLRKVDATMADVVAVTYIAGVRTQTVIGGLDYTSGARLLIEADPANPGSFVVWCAAGAGIYSGGSAVDLLASPTMAGFGVEGTVALASALDVSFDDFLARTPEGERAFHWYAYRDPALPGSPDMAGARALVRRMKPAHTHGAAVMQLNVLCDDPSTGCDREPLGGL